jgi:plastocyanin
VRRVAAVLVALLVVAPVAEGKRQRLRGTVRVGFGKAPKRWGKVSVWATPTPTPVPGATPTPSPTPGSALPAPNPRSVSVNSTEFAFTLSQTTVSAGAVRVQFDNSRAEDPHQLSIDGPDPDYWSFDEVPAGGVIAQTLVMRPGRHVLFCPLPGHEELGMRAVLTVR